MRSKPFRTRRTDTTTPSPGGVANGARATTWSWRSTAVFTTWSTMRFRVGRFSQVGMGTFSRTPSADSPGKPTGPPFHRRMCEPSASQGVRQVPGQRQHHADRRDQSNARGQRPGDLHSAIQQSDAFGHADRGAGGNDQAQPDDLRDGLFQRYHPLQSAKHRRPPGFPSTTSCFPPTVATARR